MARHRRTTFRLRRSSVEAHWPPLTPEHGFPSLLGRPGPRALPLGPLPENRGAGNVLSLHTPFVKRVKKRRGPRWAARRVRSDDDFLRWHYPHQVEGRSGCFLSAKTAPLCFYDAYYGTGGRACQGPVGPDVKKTTNHPCKVEKRGV